MLSASDGAVSLLLVTAASLASFHTLIGVDHSVPFIILGRARGWSLRRTLGITGACGLVHVASSALIGSAGLLLGIALNQLAWLESARGNVAAGLMIGFGLSYTARAVWYGFRRASHTRSRNHADGTADCSGDSSQRLNTAQTLPRSHQHQFHQVIACANADGLTYHSNLAPTQLVQMHHNTVNTFISYK